MKYSHLFTAYLAAFFVALVWGIHPVMIRMLLHPEGIDFIKFPWLESLSQVAAVDPLVLNTLRSMIGSIFLFILFCCVYPKKLNQFKNQSKDSLFFVSVIALTFGNLLYHISFKYTLATDVTLIANYAPVVVLIIYLVYSLKTHEISLSKLPSLRSIMLTVLVGCVGTSIVIINNPFESIEANNLKFIGDNIQFIGVLFWSMFLFSSHRYAKMNAHISSFTIAISTLFFSSLILAFFAIIFTAPGFFGLNMMQWCFILFLGIFSTGICYLIWYKVSKTIGVLSMVLFLNLTSVVAAITESIAYGNIISFKLLLGATMIISASIYAEVLNRRFEKSI